MKHLRRVNRVMIKYLLGIIGIMICLSFQTTTNKVYIETIPGTNVEFKMTAIPAGQIPSKDGIPTVVLDSFWMGTHEVTHDMYVIFKQKQRDSEATNAKTPFKPDAVTRPSPPYEDLTWGMGDQDGFPAGSMTQQAALRYCYWLYQKTGRFYRLPTEAEWEYACRAGTTSTYFFGEQKDDLDEYAWHVENSNNKYHKTGLKKPNPWGLYDMYGNMMEWTLDNWQTAFLSEYTTSTVQNPWSIPTKKHYRTLKGGSYLDSEKEMSLNARMRSSKKWQQRDPQIPKSKWWLADGYFVGFRLVSPMKEMSEEEVEAFFNKAIVE